jgi:hypothetical protein
VNPAHLFLGTVADNSRDMVSKGRSVTGERHHGAKLTRSQVGTIRRLRETGVPQGDLARRYGVSFGTISKVCLGTTWGNP